MSLTADFHGLNTWACIKLEGTLNWSPLWPLPGILYFNFFFFFFKNAKEI